MKDLTPQLIHTLKGYTRQDLVKDLTAGVIVAIIALPLSIALALALIPARMVATARPSMPLRATIPATMVAKAAPPA